MKLSPRNRFLAVLFVSALIGLSVLLVPGTGLKASRSPDASRAFLFDGLDISQIQTIGITTTEDRYQLKRVPEGWIMPERDDFPVQQSAMNTLLYELPKARRISARTSRDTRLDDLGLGDPDEGRTGAKIEIGSNAPVILGVKSGRQYARLSDEKQSWLIEPILPPFHRASWWLDFGALEVPSGAISDIAVSTSDGSYQITKVECGYQLISGDDSSMITDRDLVGALLDASQNLTFLDVREAIIGLDPIGVHNETFEDGRDLKIEVFSLNGEFWAGFSSSDISELFENRWFRIDPISASELIPSPDQWQE